MKKLLCLVLVISLQLSIIVKADSPSGWASDDVSRAINLGIVPESLQKNYTKAITREQYASLSIYTISKITSLSIQELEEKLQSTKFSDSNNKYVNLSFSLGIVNGVAEGLFEPKRNITRQEAAIMMRNMLSCLNYKTDNTVAPFADRYTIASWALNAVDECYNAGVFKGMPEGFVPLGTYTIEQSIVTMLRLYDKIPTSSTIGLRGKLHIGTADFYPCRIYKSKIEITYPENEEQYEEVVRKFCKGLSEEEIKKILNAKTTVLKEFPNEDTTDPNAPVIVIKEVTVYTPVSINIDKANMRIDAHTNGIFITIILN